MAKKSLIVGGGNIGFNLAKNLETDIDGIRVTTEQGWWLIRASNTGAELVARAEGRDKSALEMLEANIYQRLRSAGWKPAAK